MEHDIIVITSAREVENIFDLPPMSRFLRSSIGKQQLAQSMIMPIRTRLDYSSISRKVFLVQQLPSGSK